MSEDGCKAFDFIKDTSTVKNPPSSPATLYNAMVNPIVGYGIKGVIWYQGESNAGRSYQYRTAFPLLINDWRQKWNYQNMPFYFVQLAGKNMLNLT